MLEHSSQIKAVGINHGPIPAGMAAYSQLLMSLVTRFPKLLVFTSPLMVSNCCEKFLAAGFDTTVLESRMRSGARRQAIEEFTRKASGIFLTTIQMAEGWRVPADGILFLQCHVPLDSSILDLALQRASAAEAHYIGCMFSARDVEGSMKARGIVSAALADLSLAPASV